MRTKSLTPQDIHNHLYRVIKSDYFLHKQGLGSEIPFFICPFNPTIQLEMNALRTHLVNQLTQDGVQVLDINLYDLVIDLLRKRKIWDKIIHQETGWSKDELTGLLRNVLDPEKHLVPAIGQLIAQKPDHRVMFLSGVGEIYPYIRSHSILNNLQSTAKEQPTVMFFPGTYTHSPETGASLDLFGRLRDDKYYRAFNILNYTVQ